MTSYIESAAGVKAGGRTGLTAVTVAGLFLATLFLSPLADTIPPYATAAALLFVTCLMARSFVDIDWSDITESAPAVVLALTIPFSFSIADGIAAGFVTYAVIKLLSRPRPRSQPRRAGAGRRIRRPLHLAGWVAVQPARAERYSGTAYATRVSVAAMVTYWRSSSAR